MKKVEKNRNAGFSLVELMIAMTITLVLLGLASGLFSRALSIRARESRRTDALTSAQAALNVMSHEISNAGYGIVVDTNTKRASNGIIIADSNQQRLHFRGNIENSELPLNLATNDPGEDVTYFFDSATNSIVRYDARGINADTPLTSVVVNRISSVTFTYFDYTGSNSTPTQVTTPTADTGRVRINVSVTLDSVQGQPNGTVQFTSDVTLRNSNYMLNQY